MARHFSVVCLLVLVMTGLAEARGGRGHSRSHGHGSRGYSLGSHNFFLKPENQPGAFYCGPGLFPSQPCVAR